jgi:integrase
VVLGKLEACFGPTIDWKEINREALVQFEQYMVKLGNGPNTIRKEMSILHRVFRQAVKDGEIRADQNPFFRYDLPKSKQPERIKLSLEEIDKLAAVALKPGSWAALARDAWLISFYLGGMRFGDLASLKVGELQNGRCAYRMNKTGRLVSVPIPEPARRLLVPYLDGKQPDDFALPFLKRGDDADPRTLRRRIGSKNALCNRFIKVAAERAKLDEADSISMHISRHSFADYARQKSGNLYAISKTLGHSSLQITQQYLKSFDQEAVDQLADELWK